MSNGMVATARAHLGAGCLVLAIGAMGCSCSEDTTLDARPRLCVRAADAAPGACDPDNSTLDWGDVPAGEVTTLDLLVVNSGNGQAPLTISSVAISSDTPHSGLFDAVLCGDNCDDGAVTLPVQLPRGASMMLRLTFDATDIDGVFPVETLTIASDDSSDKVEPEGLYLRPFEGVLSGCRDGAIDANGDIEDGCECVPSEDGSEYCDGYDNDCDGTIDEDVPGTGIVCDTGQPGVCQDGTTQCVGGDYGCVADVTAGTELCDEIDNDCDGMTDEENTWQPFSDGLSGGNMSDVAFDPRWPGRAYAVVGNQVYRSDDAGESFQRAGTCHQGVRHLAFPPNDDGVILAASGSGVIQSDDDGLTWTTLSLSGLSLTTILVHPANSAHVYVGTLGGGILKSTNGAASFGPANGLLSPDNWFESITGDPSDPDIVVVGLTKLNTPQPPIGEIIRTVNGGQTWSVVKTGGRATRVSTCESDPSLLYASVVADGVYESTDGGASWSLIGLPNSQVTELALAPSDCGRIYASDANLGIYSSSDGGQSFPGPFTSGFDTQKPGDLTASVDPADALRMLVANHSGVFLTEDGGATWVRVPQISGTVARRLVVSPAAPSRAWLSTWGQGVWTRPDPTVPWQKVDITQLPRDWAMSVAPDPNDAARVLVGGWGDLWRSVDTAATFTKTPGPINVFSVAYDPTDAQTVFASDQLFGVWKSTDGGVVWNPAVNGLPAAWETGNCVCQDVRVLTIDPANNRLYAGTYLRGMFYSDDSGGNWIGGDVELADESISCLRQRQGELFACVAQNGLWRSNDGGEDFTPLTQGQNEVTNIGDMLVDDLTGELFAISDAGVFRSTDGVAWEGMDNECLPAFPNTAPAIVSHNGQRLLVIATHGAGAFMLPL